MGKGIEFYTKFKRVPSPAEQIKFYYGEALDEVDLFIMSTKFKGVNAFPPLISGKKTNVYYLSAPGLMGLNETVYRKILYDLLFCRTVTSTYNLQEKVDINVKSLKNFYQKESTRVLGLGKTISGFWIPETDTT